MEFPATGTCGNMERENVKEREPRGEFPTECLFDRAREFFRRSQHRDGVPADPSLSDDDVRGDARPCRPDRRDRVMQPFFCKFPLPV